MEFTELLHSLDERPDDAVFVGMDRITRDEFAELVRTYAGGLRKRKARSVGLLAPPGPTTLALLLAALGMGVRVDLLHPRGGTQLVAARLESAATDFVVAPPGMRFGLRGPKWLRNPLRFPDWQIWPEMLGVDDLGGAQVRRFSIDDDQPALSVLAGGTASEPVSVVYTASALAAGVEAVAQRLRVGSNRPVMCASWRAMLAAFVVGKPLLVPAKRHGAVVRQVRKWRPSHTLLAPARWRGFLAAGGVPTGYAHVGVGAVTSTLPKRLLEAGADAVWSWFGIPEGCPIAALEERARQQNSTGLHVGELVDGASAHAEDDGSLTYSGATMAPRHIEGDWVDAHRTAALGRIDGRQLWLRRDDPRRLWCGDEVIHVALYEQRLRVAGVEQAVLLGLPTGDGDRQLAVLAQGDGDSAETCRAVQRRARQLGLPVESVRVGGVPIREGAVDREAALQVVQAP